MSVTAERLRSIADRLSPDLTTGSTLICCEAGWQFGLLWRVDVLEPLLKEGGIESMNGQLFKRQIRPPDYYQKHAMNVRFMYLEFLALMLES